MMEKDKVKEGLKKCVKPNGLDLETKQIIMFGIGRAIADTINPFIKEGFEEINKTLLLKKEIEKRTAEEIFKGIDFLIGEYEMSLPIYFTNDYRDLKNKFLN